MKSVKRESAERKRKQLSAAFFLANVLLIIILLAIQLSAPQDSAYLLVAWLVGTAVMLAILSIMNRAAARDALSMLSGRSRI